MCDDIIHPATYLSSFLLSSSSLEYVYPFLGNVSTFATRFPLPRPRGASIEDGWRTGNNRMGNTAEDPPRCHPHSTTFYSARSAHAARFHGTSVLPPLFIHPLLTHPRTLACIKKARADNCISSFSFVSYLPLHRHRLLHPSIHTAQRTPKHNANFRQDSHR